VAAKVKAAAPAKVRAARSSASRPSRSWLAVRGACAQADGTELEVLVNEDFEGAYVVGMGRR
jgi:hypothetical protein